MYLEACLQQRQHFYPFVASVDVLLGVEATATPKRLASRLTTKWKHSLPISGNLAIPAPSSHWGRCTLVRCAGDQDPRMQRWLARTKVIAILLLTYPHVLE